jgi:hypothetical protein
VNTAQLQTRLRKEGFNPVNYSIEGPPPPYEGLILSRAGNVWKIEHFERGVRRELESIANEDQACERMYELLKQHFSGRQSFNRTN